MRAYAPPITPPIATSHGQSCSNGPSSGGKTKLGHCWVIEANTYGQIYLFHRNSSTPLWNFTTLPDTARCLAISADGQYLAAGTFTAVHLFNRTTSVPLWSYSTAMVDCIALSADGNYSVAGTRDGEVYLFHRTEIGPGPSNGDSIPSFWSGWVLLGIAALVAWRKASRNPENAIFF